MKKIWRSPHDDTGEVQIPKKRALLLAVRFTVFAFLIQSIGVYFTNSLALLGDTVHVLTDIFSLGMSLFAIHLSQQAPDQKRSFGLFRLEVLASFLNGVLLFSVAIGITIEAINRFLHPKEVLSIPLLFVAVFGLGLNLLSVWFLHKSTLHAHVDVHEHAHDHMHLESLPADRNIRGAILHIISDALGSVAVIIGAIFIIRTKDYWIDSVIGVGLAALIFYWAIYQLRDSLHVLLEGTPKHIDIDKLEKTILALDQRIKSIEDLHIWEITSHMYTLTMYLQVESISLEEVDHLRMQIEKILLEKFGISHSTIGVKGLGENDS